MKYQTVLYLILNVLFVSCSLFKTSQEIEQIEASKVTPPKVIEEVFSYTAKDYFVKPGEVIKLVFPYDKKAQNPKLICGEKELLVYLDEGVATAYLPESYFSKKKPYSCSFGRDDEGWHTIANLKIGNIEYPSEKLTVARKRVFLAKKDRDRTYREQMHLNKIYASSPSKPYFDEPFMMPLKSKITSYYGTRRVFNNKKRGQHLGTDFRTAVGVPIKTANSGKVVLARDLFYTGNTVIVDHGLGIFTVYGHLSKLKTLEGEFVPKGALIGLAGRTGRVTGPHLHWGVKVHGQYINGESLVRVTSQ